MTRRFLLLAATVLLAACAGENVNAPVPRQLDHANVLPLALNDHFQFRKELLTLHDSEVDKTTLDDMINFERQRIDYGAVTEIEKRARKGNYFVFFWRTDRRADVTVRLEYRQEKLDNFLQAKEFDYHDVLGSVRTEFRVTGDAYREYGRVTVWRAVIIEKGKIVAVTQSYLWR